jgi:hypothetical protein
VISWSQILQLTVFEYILVYTTTHTTLFPALCQCISMFNYVLVHVAALRGGGKWTRRCLCIHSQAVILYRSGNPMLLHCRYCYFVDSLSAIELVSMELSLLVQKRLKDILTSAMPNWTRTFWPFNCGMHVVVLNKIFWLITVLWETLGCSLATAEYFT